MWIELNDERVKSCQCDSTFNSKGMVNKRELEMLVFFMGGAQHKCSSEDSCKSCSFFFCFVDFFYFRSIQF